MHLSKKIKKNWVQPLKRSFKSWIQGQFHLNDPDRLWFDHPDLGLAFHYDYSNCAAISDYRRLLKRLVDDGRFCFQPIACLVSHATPEKITVALRHDIDNDICASLHQARVEHDLGIKASYYVLHTAPYYGFYRNGQFHRSQKCLETLLKIQSLGHEVGLHNDCLNRLIHHGTPVAETLASELDYLRSAGLNITGTISHGSFHTYQAANYEIFSGLSINGRDGFTDQNGNPHPLNHIHMADYGLTYEGNHIIRSFMVTKAFYDQMHQEKFLCPAEESDWFERDYDAQYGIFGKDFWLGTNEKEGFVDVLTESEVIQRLMNHRPGQRLVLDSHPEYYGFSLSRQWLRHMSRYVFN